MSCPAAGFFYCAVGLVAIFCLFETALIFFFFFVLVVRFRRRGFAYTAVLIRVLIVGPDTVPLRTHAVFAVISGCKLEL